ncbi:MAG: hypothetical protein GXO91_04350 [FCB group bacterium]|nr:hypothetical protein [FCB group bacterium]
MHPDFEQLTIGSAPARAVVILHGWQGNKFSLKQLKYSLNLKAADYYFPNAPYLVENDTDRRSWSLEVEPDVWEMTRSREVLEALFNEVIFPRYPSNRVYVLGFSQGALTCYELILKLDQPLGGVFPIAGFLRNPQAEKTLFHEAQRDTPILIGHGRQDQTVDPSASELAYEKLKSQGANVKLCLYRGGHKISIDYIRKVRNLITTGEQTRFNLP